MDTSDAGLIGAVIFLAQMIGKMAERLLDRVLKEKEDKKDDAPKPTGDMEKDIARLVEWHNIKDQDGVFIWYFPRRTMDEMMDLLREIRDRQGELSSNILMEIRKR